MDPWRREDLGVRLARGPVEAPEALAIARQTTAYMSPEQAARPGAFARPFGEVNW